MLKHTSYNLTPNYTHRFMVAGRWIDGRPIFYFPHGHIPGADKAADGYLRERSVLIYSRRLTLGKYRQTSLTTCQN